MPSTTRCEWAGTRRVPLPSAPYNAPMPLSCNINSRGKLARLIYGILMIVLGLLLVALWAWPGGQIWKWIIAVACLIAGGFGVFEARAGWCVVRAMGIKTPLIL